MPIVVRVGDPSDVDPVCAFGPRVVEPYYGPLIGSHAAAELVETWWAPGHVHAAVAAGSLVVAAAGDHVVGVGECGRRGADHVIHKLYVDPDHRGRGLGPRLIEAMVDVMSAHGGEVFVEHLAANSRAASFYRREGFQVQHIDHGLTGDARTDVVWRSRRPR